MAKPKRTYLKLTPTMVQSITKPGRYGDRRGGLGLSLLVKKTQNGRLSKSWAQRIKVNGKTRHIGLGSFPVVTLDMAREKAVENAQKVARGEDIWAPPPEIMTVGKAFDIVIEERSPSWRGENTKNQWQASKRYSKSIQDMPVAEVTRSHVKKVLKPLWLEKPKTAKELRAHLHTVMDWAIEERHRTESNPATAAATKGLGTQPSVENYQALDHQDFGAALADIRDADTWWATKICLIFMAFTGVRGAEARGAVWEEIDLDKAIWVIPGKRMKAGRKHRVPLSAQAKEILLYAREQSGRTTGPIFPPQRGGKYMDSGRLSSLMQDLEIQAVPHGGRSTFMGWASSHPQVTDWVADMVLAHRPSNKVKRTYLRDDFFEERVPVMQEWADYLTASMGRVTPMGPVTPTDPPPQVKERVSNASEKAKAPPAPKTELIGSTASVDKGQSKTSPAAEQDKAQKNRDYVKKRRAHRVANGVCVDAGSDDHAAAPGATRCDHCADVHRKGRLQYDRNRRARQKHESK